MDYEKIAQDYMASYQDKTRVYFIEKYLSTFNASAGKSTQFKVFPRQKEFLTSLANNKATIAIKHRQAGITTVTSAWCAPEMMFADPDAPINILCIGNKLDLAQQLITKIRDFLLQVPRYFWGEEYFCENPTTKEEKDRNTKSIFVKSSKSELELFNGSKVYARSSGPNAARGISAVKILIFDEAAFIEDGLAVYSSAVAATASVPDSKIVMISTPNGKDELYYNTYRQALSKQNSYTAVEFKWFQDLRYNKFLKWYRKNEETGENEWIEEEVLDETGTIPYDEERWRGLEKDGWKPTSPWYIKMCKDFNNDSIKIAQELDVSFMGSANNVVSSEFIEMHTQLNVMDPLKEMKDDFEENTWFWKPPIEGHRYIIAADPSRGTSEDNTAIEVIDMDGRDENGQPIVEQVAEFVGKRLGDEIADLMYRYGTLYNNAYAVFDATGGQADSAIIPLIRRGYKNVYYEDDNQKTYMLQNAAYKQTKYENRLPGFHFQGNRYACLNNFATMVRNNEFKIRSVRVINELDTWIFKGDNARMDHMSGSHDDTLTCLAMGLFVMKFTLQATINDINTTKAILAGYIRGRGDTESRRPDGNVSIAPKPKPIYRTNDVSRVGGGGSYMWLFTKRK